MPTKTAAADARFERNRDRRARADAEAEAAREELRKLLVRGRAAGLSVSGMSRTAQISRQTAHTMLREKGDDRAS